MELNDLPEPALPVERRNRPTWAWLAGAGGLTLIAILTATALELSLRPMSAPASDGALAPLPPDRDLLATVPPTQLPADPITPPMPAPVAPEPPPAAAAEASPPRPLETPPAQSARVPTRPPPPRPAAPTMPRGKDG